MICAVYKYTFIHSILRSLGVFILTKCCGSLNKFNPLFYGVWTLASFPHMNFLQLLWKIKESWKKLINNFFLRNHLNCFLFPSAESIKKNNIHDILPVNPTFLRHIKHLFLLVLALSLLSDVDASAWASGCLKLSFSSPTLLVEDEGLTSLDALSSVGGRWEVQGSSGNPES